MLQKDYGLKVEDLGSQTIKVDIPECENLESKCVVICRNKYICRKDWDWGLTDSIDDAYLFSSIENYSAMSRVNRGLIDLVGRRSTVKFEKVQNL